VKKNFDNKPLVSVIMNCYNGEKYLKEALDSVISQTYENWEIIFWDNKSTDKSAEIFKNYNDDRLHYFLNDSHTQILYKARNYALDKAKGDFIAFLDVDDWWLPYKLEKQLPLFRNEEIGLVYGNLWLHFEKNKKNKIYRKKKLPTGLIVENLLKDYVIGSPTYVIRKELIDKHKYNFNEDFHIIGDFDLNLRIAAKYKIDCIQNPIAFVRIHEKNESLLKRDMEINELKIWLDSAQRSSIFKSRINLKNIKLKIHYLETMESILKKGFTKSFWKVLKYPFCLNKVKLVVALLIPNFVLKRIKLY